MPSALSVDLRERVIAAIETGTSRRQAAKRFGVGTASAIRWPDPFRQEGRIAPKLSGGDPGAVRSASANLPAGVARRSGRAGYPNQHERPVALLRPARDHP